MRVDSEFCLCGDKGFTIFSSQMIFLEFFWLEWLNIIRLLDKLKYIKQELFRKLKKNGYYLCAISSCETNYKRR